MLITKEEFIDWKSQDVTKAFMLAAQQRIEDAKDILADTAGKEPDNDSFFRGFIHAYREIQEFHIDEEE